MTDKQKISLKEKEHQLIKKIQQAKQDLACLQDKRRLDIGKLACKHLLDAFDDKILDQAFEKLSKELSDGHP